MRAAHPTPPGDSETLAEHIERLAVQGAQGDPRTDKSDWIRLWACARCTQGKPATPDDWGASSDAHAHVL